jgi:ribosomal 50S subunit-recycling heat shock protein
MPLINSKSKKAFQKNVATEMEANPSPDKRKQNLAIAYSMKRKAAAKKMAQGGKVNESAKTEHQPSTSELDHDMDMVARNHLKKALKESGWTDNSTVTDAQNPSPTALSQPAQRGSDAMAKRQNAHTDEEKDFGDTIPPETDRAQPNTRDDEHGASDEGSDVSDMASEHSTGYKPYTWAKENDDTKEQASPKFKKVQSLAKGGMPEMEPKDHDTELMERDDEADLEDSLPPGAHGEQPKSGYDSEEEDETAGPVDMEREHSNGREAYAEGETVAEAIIKARHAAEQMAEGGEVDLDEDNEGIHQDLADEVLARKHLRDRAHKNDGQSNLASASREADNEEDELSFDALKKENYSEASAIDFEQPEDSNEHSPEHEEEDVNDDDMVEFLRKKMKKSRHSEDSEE